MFPRNAFACIAPALIASAAFALPLAAQSTPVIGSSNPVTAEPPVTRPSTTPCVVTLFSGQQFIDYNDKDFTYTPSNCKGPWAKVVFEGDFNVSEGRQFDRTAKFFLGGANVFFGTTAEPHSSLSPSWHVERDITDLSTLLTTTQPVVASLGNFYGESGGVDYNGIITGTAKLEFYPVDRRNPAPKVPDSVVPLNSAGATTALQTTTDRLTGTLTLPRNIESVYLQLFSQSQASDELWYTCSPNSVATQLQNCGNTAFRETEVYIDGKPAGIAPVYPWIYTGGLDPDLWEPITGVQTLNFKPYNVDLTPFAASLSDGQQHTVSIGVYNADSEFDVTGTLLLYLDKGSKQVTGALTKNTLTAAPTPIVKAPAPTTNAAGVTSGSASVVSLRAFTLSGYVNTSHGIVKTTVNETVNFGNQQSIQFSNSIYNENITQIGSAASITTKLSDKGVELTTETANYPLTVKYDSTQNADGTGNNSVAITQQDTTSVLRLIDGFPSYISNTSEAVNTLDQYSYSASGSIVSQKVGSTGTYKSADSRGNCYSRKLTASDLVLTAVQDGQGCSAR